MSVITGAPVSANVVATTTSQLDALDAETFHSLCDKFPVFYREISKTLSRRLLQSNQKRLATRLGKVTRLATPSGSYDQEVVFPTLTALAEAFKEETGSKPLVVIALEGENVSDPEVLRKAGLIPAHSRTEAGVGQKAHGENRNQFHQISQILKSRTHSWYQVEDRYDLLVWDSGEDASISQTCGQMDDLIFPLRPLYSHILIAQFDWPLERILEHRLADDKILFFIDLVSEDSQRKAELEDFVRYIPEGSRISPEPGEEYWVLRDEAYDRLKVLTDSLNEQAEGKETFHLVVLHPTERAILDYSRIRHLSSRVHLHTLPTPQGRETQMKNWVDGAPSMAIQMGRNCRISKGKIIRDLADLRVGLALGGGGARGIAHIGAIVALAEEGIPIDMIAGSSMGAVVAGAFAEGRTPRRLADDMRYHFGKLGNFLLDIFDYNFPRTNLLRGRKIRRMIEMAMKDSTIEDCQMPLYVVCTDLISGKEVVLDHGHLGEAIRASGSLPGIFRPVWWEGHLLVDGAVLNKVPARVLQQKGADVILAVNVTPERDTVLLQSQENLGRGFGKWIRCIPCFKEFGLGPNILRILTRSLSISGLHQSRAHSDAIDVEIKPKIENFDFLSFDRFDEILEVGASAVREALPLIHEVIKTKTR
jgi:NTE family protein